jgi:hypothetical protein
MFEATEPEGTAEWSSEPVNEVFHSRKWDVRTICLSIVILAKLFEWAGYWISGDGILSLKYVVKLAENTESV